MRSRRWVATIATATAVWTALGNTGTAQQTGRTPEDLQRALQSR
ncbi:uncharacterized protein METZ01_LOCUS90335, partial [marine metagenome]